MAGISTCTRLPGLVGQGPAIRRPCWQGLALSGPIHVHGLISLGRAQGAGGAAHKPGATCLMAEQGAQHGACLMANKAAADASVQATRLPYWARIHLGRIVLLPPGRLAAPQRFPLLGHLRGAQARRVSGTAEHAEKGRWSPMSAPGHHQELCIRKRSPACV